LKDQVFTLLAEFVLDFTFVLNRRNPMYTNISNGSWNAYNERKLNVGGDPNCYSPEEIWEFDYLVDLISAAKPHLDQITVILAVREAARRTVAPRLREHFVELVLVNISEREKQWASLVESMGQGLNVPSGTINFPFIIN